MGYYPDEFHEENERELAEAKSQANSTSVQQDIMASQLRGEETNLVKEQLSLGEELETIEHLLRGHILKADKFGMQTWAEPKEKSMVILTDHGVHLIMNTIMFYLNKNTLLSNYKEDLINKKMEDFSNSLSDSLFMESDLAFVQPTNEDAVEKYEIQLDLKIKNEMAIARIQGITITYEERKNEILEKTDVPKTIASLKEQMKKDKLKRFELIVREVQDAVHSTYLRAWNGQERRTLRQHITISETTSPKPMPQQRVHKSPMSFLRR